MPHRVGTIIAGRYRVDELLAEGAGGVVYKAYRQDMDRILALKVLCSEADNLLERFRREIKATAKLQHPNIVSIFEAGQTEDGNIFYAMEFLDGETLRALLTRESRLAADRVCSLLNQLAGALESAHSLGIIHRNLNPDDLMIAQQAGNPDFCTILDFGVARLEESVSELTMRGEILTQPEYFAPEALSEEEVATPADIYSLGCIAYECLVGRPPFQGKPRMRTVWMHVNDPVPPFPPDVVDSSPPELLEVIYEMLNKDPAARPTDGRALGLRLESLELAPVRRPTGRTSSAEPPAAPSLAPIPRVGQAQEAPAPAAPSISARQATPFSNVVVAARPNSTRPLARGHLMSDDGSRCTFLVRGGTADALAGSALAGSGSMNLSVGASVTLAVPVDRKNTRFIRLVGQISHSSGAPPELVVRLANCDDPEGYRALVRAWATH